MASLLDVKPAGKDYGNVKPLWPVCVCVAAMLYQIGLEDIFVF